MEHIDTIALYRNRRTGQYRIQPFGRLQNGSSQPFGEQQHLSADIAEEDLLRAVLVNLQKNKSQRYTAALAPKTDDAEWRRQLKEDQLIEVEASRSGYRLIPSKQVHNSFGSIDNMIALFPITEFLSRGGEIIIRLFAQIP